MSTAFSQVSALTVGSLSRCSLRRGPYLRSVLQSELAENAGADPAVILNQVKAGKGAYGYNAATGEFGDMLEEGILDPTKVTRLALRNAASVAGLLLTTEVMVAEAPQHEQRAHAGMPGGGVGGMNM